MSLIGHAVTDYNSYMVIGQTNGAIPIYASIFGHYIDKWLQVVSYKISTTESEQYSDHAAPMHSRPVAASNSDH